MNKTNIIEALYEVLTGLRGYRDEAHSKWEREGKEYLKKRLTNKNVMLDKKGGYIEIQNEAGTKILYKITISK